MNINRTIEIDASPSDVWLIVADIESADTSISGIKKIEILKQATGPSIVGLQWRETREWMGKDAVEVMWVTHASEASYYETRAESHGSIYTSRIEIEPIPTGARLIQRFDGQPVTLGAKVLSTLTGWMAKKALCKTIDQDLADIKDAVEKNQLAEG